MADDWVRLGMAIMVIAFVSVCLCATSNRVHLAEPGTVAFLNAR